MKLFPNINHWKSFILEHFRAVKLKIFFNHGESIPQQSFKKWQYCAENDPEKPEIGMKKWLDTLYSWKDYLRGYFWMAIWGMGPDLET